MSQSYIFIRILLCYSWQRNQFGQKIAFCGGKLFDPASMKNSQINFRICLYNHWLSRHKKCQGSGNTKVKWPTLWADDPAVGLAPLLFTLPAWLSADASVGWSQCLSGQSSSSMPSAGPPKQVMSSACPGALTAEAISYIFSSLARIFPPAASSSHLTWEIPFPFTSCSSEAVICLFLFVWLEARFHTPIVSSVIDLKCLPLGLAILSSPAAIFYTLILGTRPTSSRFSGAFRRGRSQAATWFLLLWLYFVSRLRVLITLENTNSRE